MPVEIKELHIKAVVSKAVKEEAPRLKQADIAGLKKEIIKECVREVMQQLKEKTER